MAKKFLKKVGKAAKKAAKVAVPLIGALALAKGLGKRGKSVANTAATEGIGWTPGSTIPDVHEGLRSNKYKFDTDHITGNVYKGGGIAKRGIGAAYKKGGRVKSMGIAKRGGGAAKR